MGISIVFAGAIMSVSRGRCVWRQFFQPNLIIMVKPALVIVDEDRSSDVHGVDEAKAFGHTAPANEFLDLRCDVDKPPSIRYLEPKMFGK